MIRGLVMEVELSRDLKAARSRSEDICRQEDSTCRALRAGKKDASSVAGAA